MIYKNKKAADQSIYYLVDGKPFWSKTRAFKECNNDLSKLSLNFMDECWNHKDLSNEPNESFSKLCIKRAKQIKNKYDAVSVFLSGGYDSMTTLYAFIDAKCLIDEIIVIDKSKFLHDPEFKNALRLANSYKNYVNSKCIITTKDYDYKFYENFYLKYRQDWADNDIWSQRFSKTGAEETIAYMPGRSAFEKFGTHNHNYVVSRDNAYVDLRDGKWYMWGLDGHLYHGVGSGVELFFYSHELPELHLKQTHNIIKWFESLPDISHELVHKIQNNDNKWYEKYKTAMGRIRPLIDHSIHGWAKCFSQSATSIDGVKVLEHFKRENKKVYDFYIEGIRKARYEQFNDLDINKSIEQNLPITRSKQWYLRDFINRSNNATHSDVGTKQDA
jgi:hypothetical protein